MTGLLMKTSSTRDLNDRFFPDILCCCHHRPRPEPAEAIQSLINSCNVKGKITLSLLFTNQPELYSNFHEYLSRHYCEENLDCWLALHQVLIASDKGVAISLLKRSLETYFTDGAPSQISCVEIYAPMKGLCDDAESLPLESIQKITAQIQHVLECNALQTALNTWLRSLRTGEQ